MIKSGFIFMLVFGLLGGSSKSWARDAKASFTMQNLEPGQLDNNVSFQPVGGRYTGGCGGTVEETWGGITTFNPAACTGTYLTHSSRLGSRAGFRFDSFLIMRSLLSIRQFTIVRSSGNCPNSLTNYNYLILRGRSKNDFVGPMDFSSNGTWAGGTFTYNNSSITGISRFSLSGLSAVAQSTDGFSYESLSSTCASGEWSSVTSDMNDAPFSEYAAWQFGNTLAVSISSGGNPVVAVGVPVNTLSTVTSFWQGKNKSVYSGLMTYFNGRNTQDQKNVYLSSDSSGRSFSISEASSLSDTSQRASLGTLNCNTLNSPSNGFCSGTLAFASNPTATGNAVCLFSFDTGGKDLLFCAAQNPGDTTRLVTFLGGTSAVSRISVAANPLHLTSVQASGNVLVTVTNLTARPVSTISPDLLATAERLATPFTTLQNSQLIGILGSGGFIAGSTCGTSLPAYSSCTIQVSYSPTTNRLDKQTFRLPYDKTSMSIVNATTPLLASRGLSSLSVSASDFTVGSNSQATVTATFADGSTQDVTALVDLTSSNNSQMPISTSGVVTAPTTAGSTTVTGTFGTVSATRTVTAFTAAPNPTNFNATAASASQIDLSWNSGGTGTVNYQIAYQTGSTAPASCSAGTLILAATQGATTTRSITGLNGNTQYSFRVCATNGAGTLTAGVTATATTPTGVATCSGDCYADSTAVNAGAAWGPGNVEMEYVFANGSSGFKVWKEKAGTRILNASGLIINGWQTTLNRAGTAFSAGNFVTATNIRGRKCPTHVFIDHTNMTETGNCLYFDAGNAAQRIDAATGTEGEDWLLSGDRTSSARGTALSYYEGNIKTCADKGMRLPTSYETTGSKPTGLPTGDTGVSPTWPGSLGVSSSSDTWTASATLPGGNSNYFFTWNGTSYWYARNDSSKAVICVLPSNYFLAPTSLVGYPGTSQVVLGWSAPSRIGDSVVSDYVIQYSSDNESTWTTFNDGISTNTTAQVTGLSTGTSYSFRVAAVNAAGTGPFTDSISVTPASSTPSPPTNVVGSPGATQVALNWTAPISNGGSAITDYVVEYLEQAYQTETYTLTRSSSNYTTSCSPSTNGAGSLYDGNLGNGIATGNGAQTIQADLGSAKTIIRIRLNPLLLTCTWSTNYLNGTNLQYSTDGTNWTTFAVVSETSEGSYTDYFPNITARYWRIQSTGFVGLGEFVLQTNSASWVTSNDGISTSTSSTVTGLNMGTNYNFRVSAKNSVGTGSPSAQSALVTTLNLSGAPTNLAGTAGNAQVALTWSAPTSNGGSAITDYAVQFSSNNGTSWTTFNDGTSTSTSATVTSLSNSLTYIFRVAAVTAVGTGTYSSSSASFNPGIPGAPTSVTGTAGNGQVALTWAAPASVGASAISDYVIQHSSNNGGSWTTFSDTVSTATSVTVTGLVNATAYLFRVAAVNASGQGLYSTNSASVTPRTIPGAPTGVTGSGGGSTQISVSWTAPSSNGSAITDYVIQYSSNSGTSWTTFTDGTSSDTSALVTGLVAGTSYIFRVAAVNAAGTGSYSANSTSATPQLLSCASDCYLEGTAPNYAQAFAIGTERLANGTTLTLTAGASGFKVWTEKGGTRILNATGTISNGWQKQLTRAGTGFTETNLTAVSNIAGRACPTHVFLDHSNMTATSRCVYYDAGTSGVAFDSAGTGLTEGEDWLQGWNRAATGRGTASSYYEGNIKTCADKGMRLPTIYETQMTKPTSNLPTGDVDVNPTWPGTAGVPSAGIVSGSDDCKTASAYTWSSSYYFQWRDTAEWSNPFNSTSYKVRCVLPNSITSAPGAPTGLTATAGLSSANLTWVAPTNNGGASINDYSIQYSSDSGASWTTFTDPNSTATSLTITGLNGGTAYIFRVAAVNAEGTGTYSSNSASVTPYALPGAPTSVAGTAGNTQVALNWNAPSSNGSTISDYVIVFSSNSGTSWTTFNDGASTTTSATVTGLVNNTAYIFRVSAVNTAGTGAASSNSASITPNPAPTITSVSPTAGVPTGDGTLTITGTGFLSGLTVTVGGAACTSPTRVSATQATCTLPSGTPGAKNVVITNSDTQSGTLANGYTYYKASGGTVSECSRDGVNYVVHTFTSTGSSTFTVGSLGSNLSVDYLIVGGGGAGGSGYTGGGGGGGGVLTGTGVSLTSGSSNTITVGAGGTSVAGFNAGNNGGNSSALTYTAYGGGGGGAGNRSIASGGNGTGGASVASGGGGGGGPNTAGTGQGGTATNTTQGKNGGNARLNTTATSRGGGGGGGAGAAATNAGTNGTGTAGGAGVTSYYRHCSSVVYYGGGGGGGGVAGANAAGGDGGGGQGGNSTLAAGANGVDTRGGGGGGAGPSAAGGSGGSGIVIIRYVK